MMFKGFFSGLVDFLFPKAPDILELEALSPFDLLHKLTPGEDLGEDTLALFNYADPRVRALIWELKYRKNQKIAESMAIMLYDVLKTELADRAIFENFSSPLLIPLPISSKRRLERGYNQTEVLSQEVLKLDSEHLLQYDPNILQKSKHTESQTLIKNKKQRMLNIEGTMLVASPELVKGRNIILLDDVTTTGATIRDARRALRESGAKKILSVALAH
jgi:ComF family protein